MDDQVSFVVEEEAADRLVPAKRESLENQFEDVAERQVHADDDRAAAAARADDSLVNIINQFYVTMGNLKGGSFGNSLLHFWSVEVFSNLTIFLSGISAAI